MAEAEFKRNFDYRVPNRNSIVAYVAGWSGSLPQAHLDAAIAAGAVEEIEDDGKAKPQLGAADEEAAAASGGSTGRASKGTGAKRV